MNDPNGLVYVNGKYELYYQYNPVGYVAGNQNWGHAESTDLLHWRNLPIAIPETPAGEIFSGSAVLDVNNTSGFFNGIKDGLVAIYTLNTPTKQLQNIAYSIDGGKTYKNYAGNPVIDLNEANFRDPKVFYHAPSKSWVMAVSLANAHMILFYRSPDLKHWTLASKFGPSGVPGVAFECPNLIEVPVEGTSQTKWVLLVSINPGAPQGGSATQYFVGNFDGTNFTPDDTSTRFMDFGKDFYAVQTYNNLPVSQTTAIGWLSNWQYTNVVPTSPWRGTDTLPRLVSVRAEADGYHLIQNPISLAGLVSRKLYQQSSTTLGGGDAVDVPLTGNGAFEFTATLTGPSTATQGMPLARIDLSNANGEKISVGYDFGIQQIFIDRGNARLFQNPFFSNDLSTYLALQDGAVKIHGIVDHSVLEIFADDGEAVGSSVFFMSAPPSRLRMSSVGGSVAAQGVVVNALRSVWP